MLHFCGGLDNKTRLKHVHRPFSFPIGVYSPAQLQVCNVAAQLAHSILSNEVAGPLICALTIILKTSTVGEASVSCLATSSPLVYWAPKDPLPSIQGPACYVNLRNKSSWLNTSR